ncbi:MAG: efflux RND transporter periplasmic adaptor subunit [Cyanobacteria bacterium P01_D01_bin.14]
MSSDLVSIRRFYPISLKWLRTKWYWFVVGVLILLGLPLLGGLVAANRSSESDWVTQSVERSTVPVVITANGTVEGARSINLSPNSSGIIQSLRVEEGDRVRQGQVIAVMDDANLRGELLQMQGQLAQQQANLDKLVAGERSEDIARAEAQLAESESQLTELQAGNRSQEIAQAAARLQQSEATLAQREANLQRYEALYQQGAISREEVDQKRVDRDVAQAQVEEAQEALALQNAGARPEQIDQAAARVEQQRQTVAELKAGTRSEEIAQAQAQVQSAQGSLQTAQSRLDDTQVTAPFDGVVNEIYAEVGSFVSPSTSVSSEASSSSSSILMLSSSDYQVVVNLPESQISRVELGQPVTFTADAFPGETFTGEVDQIAVQASVTQNVTSFEVRVSVDEAAAKGLRIGMNVEAAFEVGTLQDALLVPNAAVVRTEEGEGVYMLSADNKPVFQPIETGDTAAGQTEVIEGLDGDEQVLIGPPAEDNQPERGLFPPASP